MQVHRNGVVKMPKNKKSKNGDVTVIKPPEELWRAAIELAGGDSKRLIWNSSTEVIVTNSDQHTRYLIRKVNRGKRASK